MKLKKIDFIICNTPQKIAIIAKILHDKGYNVFNYDDCINKLDEYSGQYAWKGLKFKKKLDSKEGKNFWVRSNEDSKKSITFEKLMREEKIKKLNNISNED